MHDVAVIGNVTRDVVDGGAARPGGTVTWAARALAQQADRACSAVVVARGDAALVDAIRALAPGVFVEARPCAAPTGFSFRYVGEARVMHVDAISEPWTVDDVAGIDARWVHVGGLLRGDVPLPVLRALASRGARLLLDAQGLARVSRVGPLIMNGDVDRAVLACATALKLDEDEARALAGADDDASLRALNVPEVLLTRGLARLARRHTRDGDRRPRPAPGPDARPDGRRRFVRGHLRVCALERR